MEIFKKIIILILCIASFGVCVYAHPGDTDSAGGHYDRSTGEYHYHHGYPAHQHYDIDGDGKPDCPYDFDDRTGKNSGSSSKLSGTTSQAEQEMKRALADRKRREEGAKKSNLKPTQPSSEPDFTWMYVGGTGLLAVAFFLLYRSEKKKKQKITEEARLQLEKKEQEFEEKLKIQRQDSDRKIRELQNLLTDEKQKNTNLVHAYMEDRSEIMKSMYGERYLYILAGATSHDEVDETLLPREQGATEYWGQKYTFYYGPPDYAGRRIYHTKRCRSCNMAHPINAYNIHQNSDKYSSCMVCHPRLPDVEWVDRYLYYKEFLEKFLDTEKE